jgi:hypothetical protein
MFTITIQKPTGEEAIAELVRVAKFYERFEGASAQGVGSIPADTEGAAEAQAPSPRKPRAKKSEPGASLESGQFGAAVKELSQAAPAPEPAPEPAPAPAPAALDGEALRVKIRTVLTPLMKGEKAGAARALIKTYGDSITAIADDKLPALLAEAEAL